MDRIIFNFINQYAGEWQVLDYLAIFFAKYFEYVLLFILLVFFVRKFRKNFPIMLQAIFAAIISRFVMANIIRGLWFRARPFVQHNVNLLFSYDAGEASFPSGHASFYFALSTIIYFYNKRLGIGFFIGSFLICLARIFSGIHWPSDILAGILVGIITALIVHASFKFIKRYFK